jgi:Icc-related predicted phosphoesterase
VKNRIFFVSDVHGSDICFKKFINGAKFYKADTLILGGDITGKALIPIVEQGGGKYTLNFHGESKVAKKNELESYQNSLRNSGYYYFITNSVELEELRQDRNRIDEIFLESMKKVLKDWLKLADERLRGSGVKCYISPGNDDRFEIDEILQDTESVTNPEGRVVTIGDHEMITLGYANPTPWKSPREVSEEKLQEKIQVLATQLKDPQKSIFNLHVPPIDSEIDKAPAVSENFEYVREGIGGMKMISAGSVAVRASIERYQPLLGLHGHIHESRGFVKVGRTTCINPGSDYSDGMLRGALVNLEDGGLKEFLLTVG